MLRKSNSRTSFVYSDTISFSEFNRKLADLPANKAAPAEWRVNIFKTILKSYPDSPEKIPVSAIRQLLDHDLNVAKWCLNDWGMDNERARLALKNIELFFSQIVLPEKMSFFEHSYYCFCLSALISGVAIKDIQREYKKPIKTMVYGVVHPLSANWSIQNELENQNYSKFICHVSKTGLVGIEQINQVSAFRLNKESPFCGIRLLAIACNEWVEFDGVKEMVVDNVKRETRSLDVLNHDFIHAGFLKRHYEKNPEDFYARFAKVGEVYEKIIENQELKANDLLRKKVQLAWAFWFHEYPTSAFVDGIPETLPKQHKRVSGQYALEPQMLLKEAARFNFFPALFANEIDVELSFFKSLHIRLNLPAQEDGLSQHDLVKEMIEQLNDGYAFLDHNYAEFYNSSHRTHWRKALLERVIQDSPIARVISTFFSHGSNLGKESEKATPLHNKY